MSHALKVLACTLALACAASLASAAENGARNRGERARAIENPPPPIRNANGAPRGAPAQLPPFQMTLGPEEQIYLANLRNAPNGHISFQSSGGGLRIWVSGRPTDATKLTGPMPAGSDDNVQSTFVISPNGWGHDALKNAPAQIAYTHMKNDTIACDYKGGQGFDRDYAAVNAVVPGANGAILGFIDGEYHPSGKVVGQHGLPLLASIGVANLNSGSDLPVGMQIIKGLDEAFLKGCVAAGNKLNMSPPMADGADGPSAIVRTDGGTQYIYVYYSDRIAFAQKRSADIHVARARLADYDKQSAWQKWNGKGWGPQDASAAVVTAPQGAREAQQPSVSYNTVLKRWLMVFRTETDLYATQSEDGLSWTAPQPLAAGKGSARQPVFPTLISSEADNQMTTGGDGWVFYARNVGSSFSGFRRAFKLTASVPEKCVNPRQCCDGSGGGASGGRCQ